MCSKDALKLVRFKPFDALSSAQGTWHTLMGRITVSTPGQNDVNGICTG